MSLAAAPEAGYNATDESRRKDRMTPLGLAFWTATTCLPMMLLSKRPLRIYATIYGSVLATCYLTQDALQQRVQEIEERRVKRTLTLSTMQPTSAPSDANALQSRRSPFGGGPPGGSSGPGSRQQLTPANAQPQVGRDGPHLTMQLPDESEPVAFANTNYDWKSDNAVADLEAHVEKLRVRRDRMAKEAEFIWAWLSEKEAEFHNSPDWKTDGPERKAKLRYLENLGSVHTKTWLEASSCDWMIADSKKRIEQLRSATANDEGKVTWQASCSDNAARIQPTFALKLLKMLQQQSTAVNNTLEQMKASAAIEMADPDFEMKETTKVFNPIQQKMTTEKELLMDANKELENTLEDNHLVNKVAGEIISEAEKRSKSNSR